MPLSQTRTNLCPFCDQLFGNHLPHCKQRCGREYSSLLAKNRVAPARSCRGTCPKCGRLFQRLDTHLRLSASCRDVTPSGPCREPTHSTDPPTHSQLDARTTSPTATTTTTAAAHAFKAPLKLPKSAEEWEKATI